MALSSSPSLRLHPPHLAINFTGHLICHDCGRAHLPYVCIHLISPDISLDTRYVMTVVELTFLTLVSTAPPSWHFVGHLICHDRGRVHFGYTPHLQLLVTTSPSQCHSKSPSMPLHPRPLSHHRRETRTITGKASNLKDSRRCS